MQPILLQLSDEHQCLALKSLLEAAGYAVEAGAGAAPAAGACPEGRLVILAFDPDGDPGLGQVRAVQACRAGEIILVSEDEPHDPRGLADAHRQGVADVVIGVRSQPDVLLKAVSRSLCRLRQWDDDRWLLDQLTHRNFLLTRLLHLLVQTQGASEAQLRSEVLVGLQGLCGARAVSLHLAGGADDGAGAAPDLVIPIRLAGRSLGELRLEQPALLVRLGLQDSTLLTAIGDAVALALHRQELAAAPMMQDPVTGLRDEAFLQTALALQFDQWRHFGISFSVAVLGIDGFAALAAGLATGQVDHLLREFSELISCFSRSPDIVTHLAGAEFSLLLPFANLHEASAAAEHLRAAVAGTRWAACGAQTASVGVAEVSRHDHQPLDPYRRALAARQRAAAQGGDRVCRAPERLVQVADPVGGVLPGLVLSPLRV